MDRAKLLCGGKSSGARADGARPSPNISGVDGAAVPGPGPRPSAGDGKGVRVGPGGPVGGVVPFRVDQPQRPQRPDVLATRLVASLVPVNEAAALARHAAEGVG